MGECNTILSAYTKTGTLDSVALTHQNKLNFSESSLYFATLTLSLTTNFRFFQTQKCLQMTIFLLDENGRKFSECVQNTVGKGEIARNEQFLIFSQCFQNTYAADM